MIRFIAILLVFHVHLTFAQFYSPETPLAHTYSIVAIDEETGDMGVAVQSHWFSVGTIVNWGEAGVGVVATQSFVNPAFGPDGLELLRNRYSAQKALDSLISIDDGRNFRQLAILDAEGNVAVFTGKKCIHAAGHQTGEGYSVQANLMDKNTVWPSMAQAFETSRGKPLAERLLLALEAAEAEGGDIRGKQSAALLVVAAENTGRPWVDRLVDLRVDDHDNPLKELRRLLNIHTAYQAMNAGDVALEMGKMQEAMELYNKASNLEPDNVEMRFWTGITLINAGEWEKGNAILKAIYREDERWKRLTPRLAENGLLEVSEEELEVLVGK